MKLYAFNTNEFIYKNYNHIDLTMYPIKPESNEEKYVSYNLHLDNDSKLEDFINKSIQNINLIIKQDFVLYYNNSKLFIQFIIIDDKIENIHFPIFLLKFEKDIELNKEKLMVIDIQYMDDDKITILFETELRYFIKRILNIFYSIEVDIDLVKNINLIDTLNIYKENINEQNSDLYEIYTIEIIKAYLNNKLQRLEKFVNELLFNDLKDENNFKDFNKLLTIINKNITICEELINYLKKFYYKSKENIDYLEENLNLFKKGEENLRNIYDFKIKEFSLKQNKEIIDKINDLDKKTQKNYVLQKNTHSVTLSFQILIIMASLLSVILIEHEFLTSQIINQYPGILVLIWYLIPIFILIFAFYYIYRGLLISSHSRHSVWRLIFKPGDPIVLLKKLDYILNEKNEKMILLEELNKNEEIKKVASNLIENYKNEIDSMYNIKVKKIKNKLKEFK